MLNDGGGTEGIFFEFGEEWMFVLEACFGVSMVVLFFDELSEGMGTS